MAKNTDQTTNTNQTTNTDQTNKPTIKEITPEFTEALGVKLARSIPEQYHQKYLNIATQIVFFCQVYETEDAFKKICLKALGKLCRKNTEPLSSGRDYTWAAGIVYAIARNCNMLGNRGNFLLGTPRQSISADEISSFFKVSKGGVSEKSKIIQEELGITQSKSEWLLPSQSEMNDTLKSFGKLMRMDQGRRRGRY